MRGKRTLILILTLALIVTSKVVSFSQEEEIKPEQAVASQQPQTQWLWGEVISLDAQNKSLVVKYFDYESETEKEIPVSADENTVYEGVKSFEEIKLKDTVSVDYVVAAEGKNIAENISVEQAEGREDYP